MFSLKHGGSCTLVQRLSTEKETYSGAKEASGAASFAGRQAGWYEDFA